MAVTRRTKLVKLGCMASVLGLSILGARRLASTMPNTLPPALTVPPLTKHTATVLFIHGLGDTGDGWRPVADMFQADPGLSHVKWVLPHSPSIKVTANMGLEMPSWFDIISFGFDCEEDETGMLRSAHAINQLISAEIDSGVPPERIVVGGFSQGAAMSLLTGLSNERKVAGIVALSGWAPLRHKLKAMASRHATSIPIFWGHGTHDPLVKFEFALDSIEFLKNRVGIPATTLSAPDAAGLKGICFNTYSTGHSTTEKELDDLKGWLKKVIPSKE
ncbi:Phospholipase/carboxylesterase [Dentipellis sp. KUC8613]|nr:Phospholipase/carboxylesterase [Dentipellis sp. KUC8613]